VSGRNTYLRACLDLKGGRHLWPNIVKEKEEASERNMLLNCLEGVDPGLFPPLSQKKRKLKDLCPCTNCWTHSGSTHRILDSMLVFFLLGRTQERRREEWVKGSKLLENVYYQGPCSSLSLVTEFLLTTPALIQIATRLHRAPEKPNDPKAPETGECHEHIDSGG
jgi:hypothetical protein